MVLYALVAVLLIVVYGLLTAYASFQRFKAEEIEPWAAVGMFAASLALIGAGFLLGESSPYTLPLLIVALIGLHALAVANGPIRARQDQLAPSSGARDPVVGADRADVFRGELTYFTRGMQTGMIIDSHCFQPIFVTAGMLASLRE